MNLNEFGINEKLKKTLVEIKASILTESKRNIAPISNAGKWIEISSDNFAGNSATIVNEQLLDEVDTAQTRSYDN